MAVIDTHEMTKRLDQQITARLNQAKRGAAPVVHGTAEAEELMRRSNEAAKMAKGHSVSRKPRS